MKQGTIVGLDFGNYLVHLDGATHRVTMPKTDKITLTPLVGDRVDVDVVHHHILAIHPRISFIKRPRIANLNRLVIVSSMVEPSFSFHLLALFITFARYYNLAVNILITKVDLIDPSTYRSEWDYLISAGFSVDFFDKFHPDMTLLKRLILPHEIVAFAGQTGVGKSSVINAINPDYQRTIGSYSQALGRGKHQTKEVVLLPWLDGFIADTPGFSSLTLPMLKHEAAKVFPGFEQQFHLCKFFNCTHTHEPDCRIQALVKHGKIPLSCYEAYTKLIAKLPEQKEFH